MLQALNPLNPKPYTLNLQQVLLGQGATFASKGQPVYRDCAKVDLGLE